MTHTITAIVMECTSPLPPVYPQPLIFVLEVIDPQDEIEITRLIADQRYNDLMLDGDEAQDNDIIDQIVDGLELCFVFRGDVTGNTVDFRT